MSAVVVEERVRQLPIKSLVASPKNPRGEPGDVAELAESIKAQGIVEPLIVVQLHVQPDETYRVVAGHRRLAAARLAGLKTVPGLVRQLGEREQLMTMLVENLQRQDLSPLQEARGYQELASLEYSQREIARQVGKSQSHVAKRLGLLKLTPAATAKFESGGITAEDAVTLAALPGEQQDRVLKETHYGSMQHRIRELQWMDEAKKRREAEAKKPKPKVDRKASTAAIASQKAKAKELEEAMAAAREARAKVLPRLLSRGERALQFAAGALVYANADWGDPDADAPQIACELLKLKAAKRKFGGIAYSEALARHAAKSKKAAVDVLVAFAIANAEAESRDLWASGSETRRAYIAQLQKVGYKPNAHDRFKGRRR